MRAVQIDSYGGPDVLRINDAAPRPAAPGPGEVLVKVVAAGVNPLDWKIREGYMKDFVPLEFPATLGNEFSGTIESVGPGVNYFLPGDAVYGATMMMGSYAEYATVKMDILEKKPHNISHFEAASLPVAIATSVAALNAGDIKKGSRVLIHAAAGGVGSIALQIAKLRGAHVTALGSSANLQFLSELGADHVVDRKSDYESTLANFDIILDAYGVPAQGRSWKLLHKGGILVSIAAPPDEATATQHGVRSAMVFFTPSKENRLGISPYIEQGSVKATVSHIYRIDEAKLALAAIQSGTVRGKLVLSIGV